MRLFIAGLYTSNFDLESNLIKRLNESEANRRREVANLLESYHYINKDIYVRRIRRDKKRVFLDSGAFSAFTKGVKVDLVKYCDYIKRNEDIIECASVLDSIGDAQGTYENQCLMEQEGVRPLPCFHYGEDERYLEHYIKNYEFITLGGMVPISTPQLKLWLDRLWDKYLTDENGRPKIKVHGFGLTVISLMTRYPWYSVDSSSWIQVASRGNIMHPDYGMIPLSDRSPARKDYGKHFCSWPPAQQEVLRKDLESKGFDLDRMSEDHPPRWAYSCWSYHHLGERISNEKTDPKFIPEQRGFF